MSSKGSSPMFLASNVCSSSSSPMLICSAAAHTCSYIQVLAGEANFSCSVICLAMRPVQLWFSFTGCTQARYVPMKTASIA